MRPLLQAIKQHNLYNLVSKEVMGTNLPSLFLVMNTNEFVDNAVLHGGEMLAVMGLGRVLTQGYKALLSRFMGKLPAGKASQFWQNWGISTFAFGQMMSAMAVLPLLRNALMAHITKTTRFVDLVGLNAKSDKPDNNTHHAVASQIKQSLGKAGVWYGVGMGLTVFASGVAALLAKKGVAVPKACQWLYQRIGLPQGDYQRLPDLSALLCWSYPLFISLWANARDKTEQREIMVEAAGFALAFTVIPRQLERLIKSVMGHGAKAQEKAFWVQLFSGGMLCSLLPTLSNLVLRRQRAAAMGLLDDDTPLRSVKSGLELALPRMAATFKPFVVQTE
jgi:hypothetical protein